MSTPALSPFSTATAWRVALRRHALSARELLDLYLARIDRYNPTLNAIVTLDREGAIRAANAADVARARGEDAPLLGLPLTIKDYIEVAGLPSTGGEKRNAGRMALHDAPLVRRLCAAGAVILGKTNVPPSAGDWQTDNLLYGRTNNPWDHTRTPGGSTGGGAAALAASLTTGEFGSDLGGSIRIPAAFCGLYGHRPSETALPRAGHFPGSPLPNSAMSLLVLGPLARSAEDLELFLDVAAAPEAGEDVAWHIAIPPVRHMRLADYRVAVLPPIEWLPVAGEILAAQERVLDVLRDAGAHVETAQPSLLGDLREYYKLYRSLLWVVNSHGWPATVRRSLAGQARSAGDPFHEADALGLEASADQYLAWHAAREAYRADFREFFGSWDVLLAPVAPVVAFPHLAMPFRDRQLIVDGQDLAYDLLSAFPAVATLCGQPATAFPAGLSGSGLPIGLQAVGPYLEDRTPLRFAGLLAERIGGFVPPPAYALP